LANAETDPLAVEIARKSTKTVWRRLIAFESASQCQAAIRQRFIKDRRQWYWLTVEQRGPRLGTDFSVNAQSLRFLEVSNRGFRATAEYPVHRAPIQI
jgi:hypothetical protein